MRTVEFRGVWEKYRIKFIQRKNVFWEEFWALEDINFGVNKGEVLGIIGENGAGKTTLLKLIAGMLVPDRGEVYVQGKVSALMELGAGFNPEFTGRENIILNAKMYGLDEGKLCQQMGKIIEFAGLGKFIDAPIKYYSQGMYMRLAFALAIYVEPDILLIDDILAVGDEEAQQKCIKKIFQLKQTGKTILVVSHDMNMIGRLCDQVILLERGKIVQRGSPQEVAPRYLEVVGDKKGIAILEKEKLRAVFNNGRIIINYDGTTLTKGMGGYVSFFVPTLNAWSSSFNLDWQIRSSRPNEIVAEGLYQDGTIAQIWVIRIQEDQLQWRVEVRDDSIREPHIDLLLIPDYKGWASLERDGEFGLFAHKFNWREVGLDNYQDNIVGMRANLEKNNLPFLTLEIENKDSQLKLLNTGYNQEARVIQLRLIEGNYISTRIKIFPDVGIFEEHIEQLRDEFLLKQQHEQARLRALHTISSGSLRLFADLEARCLRLYFKDKEITRSSGLHISFLLNKTWYDSSSCDWQVERGKDTLILNLSWKQLGFSSSWRLSFKDNCLLWQADSEFPQQLDLLKFGLAVIPEYKTFFTAHQQGNFPSEFTHWQDMVLEEPKAELFGLRKANELPAVVLENNKNLSCLIQNSDAQNSCRTLQLSLPKQALKKKRHFPFSTRLSLLEDKTLIDDYIKEQKQKILLKQQQEKQKLLLKQQQERDRLLTSRTISSGSLRLFADSEARCLRLYFKDKEITRSSGLHISFLLNKTWYDSSSCDWQVERGKDTLILNLSWKQLGFSSSWRLSFKDNCLLWQADSEFPQQLDLLKFGLAVIPEYKTFFAAHQQGNFLGEFTHWQDMVLEEPQAELFGLRKANELPAVVLENNKNLSCLIQNSDQQTSCRTLQLSLPKQALKKRRYFSFSTKLSLLEDETLIKGYIKQQREKLLLKQQEKKQKLLLKQQQERDRLLASRTITSGSLRLFADSEAKSLRLYYKNKEITKAGGLHSLFNVSENWFRLKDARWRIDKVSERRLALTLDYEPLSLLQIWTLTCKDEHILEIRVEIEVNKTVFLTNQHMRLELQDKYKDWLSAYEQGSLLVDQYINNIGPIRLKDSKVSKVVLRAKKENDFPELFFGASFHLDKRIMAIYKYKGANGAYLCLDSSLIIPKKETLINAGRYTYFEGKVILGKESKLDEESAPVKVVRLSKGNLRFAFDRGKGNIFWAGKELTTGLSTYTSVRCSGIWYDSYQADWKVKQKGNNKITVTGDWPHIPVSQTWQIELINRNLISWQVDMEIYEEVNLEIEQASLMLSSEYKNWIVSGFTGGDFLDEYTQDYDILPFRFWYGKAERMAAAANTLPKIVFKSDASNKGSRAIVENTDNLHQARLLQYQKVNNSSLLPGNYLYFKGIIEIGPKE